MKRIRNIKMMFLSIALIIFSACSSSSQNNSETIVVSPKESETAGFQFQESDWDQAQKKASEENKLIFVDAYASWCGPCKRMAKNVFTDPEVGQFFNEHFINFKMDMEEGVGVELSRKWGLDSYPTLYFIDGNGERIATSVGYHSIEDLLELGRKIVAIG